MILDPIQIILTIVIFILTVTLVFIAVQIFKVLEELRKTLKQLRKITTDIHLLTHAVTKPVTEGSEFFMGLKRGVAFFKSLQKLIGREDEDEQE
jgi:hypothetical protein